MMNPVILLSPNNSARSALRKVLETLYVEPPFTARDLPEAPAEIDVNEFIVSEAMKLACNDNERVLILGINKKDVIEKDIPCDKFDSLVKFFPNPIMLQKLFAVQYSLKPDGDLAYENKCSIFGSDGFQIYSEKFLDSPICHNLIKNMHPTYVLNEDTLNKFRENVKLLDSLSALFIPDTDLPRVESFIKELKAILPFAKKDTMEEFRKKYVAFRQNERLLAGFPASGY